MKTRILFAVLLVAVLVPIAAHADVPNVLPFQAVLRDNEGNILPDNTDVTFAIYDAATAGALLWGPEVHTVTPVDGVVSVFLGSQGSPISASIFTGESAWLGIEIGGEALSRLQIGSTAFAFLSEEAVDARKLGGQDPSAFSSADHNHSLGGLTDVDLTKPGEGDVLTYRSGVWMAEPAGTSGGDPGWMLSGPNLYTVPGVTGNVGIGTETPAFKLDVVGGIRAGDIRAVNDVYENGLTLSAQYVYRDEPDVIGTDMLQDFSVTDLKLFDGSITAPKIAFGAVGADAIEDESVGSGDIDTDAVGDDELQDFIEVQGIYAVNSGLTQVASLFADERGLGGFELYDTGGVRNVDMWGDGRMGAKNLYLDGVSGNALNVKSSAMPMYPAIWGQHDGTADQSGIPIGVYGTASDGDGVWGVVDHASQFGIRGINENALGTAALGAGNGLTPFYLSAGSGGAFTGKNFGIFGYATDNSDATGGYFANGAGDIVRVAYRNAQGQQFKIQGSGTVSSVMETPSAGRVGLIAPESPEAWVQEIGSGEMKNGSGLVSLDKTYLDCVTITEKIPMRVLVQFTSPPPDKYYVRKFDTGFEVIDASGEGVNATFDFFVNARWKGWENVRFDPVAPSVSPVIAQTAEIQKPVSSVSP